LFKVWLVLAEGTVRSRNLCPLPLEESALLCSKELMGAVVSGVGHGVRLGQMKPFLTENHLVSLCTLSAKERQ